MLAAFCWPQSARSDGTISLHAHGDAQVDVRVSRIGLKKVEVAQWPAMRVRPQTLAGDAAAEGCDWDELLSIRIEPEWSQGFYLVELVSRETTAEAFFVVKGGPADDRAELDGVLVLSTTTWAAYNDWGGPSFYTGGHRSCLRRPLPRGFLSKTDPHLQRVARFIDWTEEERAALVEQRYSQWCMAAGWANWEYLFVRWAEAQGLNLGYAVSQDLAEDPDVLKGARLYLSVGHDEYWTADMRDTVERYVDEGGAAAFFGGNVSFWQARLEGDDLVCYKMSIEDDPVYDPNGAASLSTMWSDPLVGRPENHMTGVSFTRGGYAHMPESPQGSGGYAVHNPGHWVFSGLDLERGNQIGAQALVVGYECDGCVLEEVAGKLVPTGVDGTPLNFEVLATAPARLWETHQLPENLRDDYVGELNWVAGRVLGGDSEANRAVLEHGHAVMGIFDKGAGRVFTTGCTDWAYGLDDPVVSGITKNVLSGLPDGR